VEYVAKIQGLELEIKRLESEIKQKNGENQSKDKEKDQIIRTLNEKISVIEEELFQVKREKEAAIRDRDGALSTLSESQSKVSEEVESRVEVQIELTNLKEKLTDFVRRESEAKEKSVEYVAKIQGLELEIKRLESEIKQAKEKQTIKTNIEYKNNIKSQNQDDKNYLFQEKTQLKNNFPKKINKFSNKVENIPNANTSKTNSTLADKKIGAKLLKKQNIKNNKYLKEFFSNQSKEELIKKLHENEPDSDSNCNYYLGYLAEREKDETIPATCIECPKSIDCMLKKVHKSTKSVKEIKKWYHFR
jgi:chromosome segregation ATPase